MIAIDHHMATELELESDRQHLIHRMRTLAREKFAPRAAHAQNRLGGHFGAVFPLVARAGGTTVTLADDFSIGFPMGITVKTSDQWAFDLELVG